MAIGSLLQQLQNAQQNQTNTTTSVDPADQLGFDRITFRPNDDIQRLQVFGVNNERTAGTGAFRSFREGLENTARLEGVDEDAEEAVDQAGRVSAVNAGTFDRRTATFGLTARQRRAARRGLGLRRAIAEADAGSAVRRAGTNSAIAARETGAALGDQSLGLQLAALTNLANAEGQRRIRRANEEAADDANRNGLIGSVVGAGLALFSSEKMKDKRGKAGSLLDKLAGVRVEKWKYKADTGLEQNDHIGVYAEEFNDTFGVNQDNRRMVSLIDLLGVSMGALKELNQKVEALGG